MHAEVKQDIILTQQHITEQHTTFHSKEAQTAQMHIRVRWEDTHYWTW